MDNLIEKISFLRKKTNCGLIDCKKSLLKANSDVRLAYSILKYYSLAVNIKGDRMQWIKVLMEQEREKINIPKF